MDYKTLSSQEHPETSEDIRARVEKARTIQRERFKPERGMHTNASMTPRLIRKHCELNAEASGYLKHAMNGNNFSARAHDRFLKVARTLADLHKPGDGLASPLPFFTPRYFADRLAGS